MHVLWLPATVCSVTCYYIQQLVYDAINCQVQLVDTVSPLMQDKSATSWEEEIEGLSKELRREISGQAETVGSCRTKQQGGWTAVLQESHAFSPLLKYLSLCHNYVAEAAINTAKQQCSHPLGHPQLFSAGCLILLGVCSL